MAVPLLDIRCLLVDEPPKDFSGIKIALVSHSPGDFISFYKHSSRFLDVVIGNASSAVIGVAIKGEIAQAARTERSFFFDHHHFWQDNLPSIREIISQVNMSPVRRLLKFPFCLSYGRLDLERRILTFMNSGSTKAFYFRDATKKGTFIQETSEVPFEADDFFVFYSEGVIGAMSLEKERFGENRLKEIIESSYALSSEELSNKVKSSVMNFTGKAISEENFTLIILRIDHCLPIEASSIGVAKFSSILNHLQAVRDFTKELCSKAPGDTERLSSELQLAIDEVFTNIVIHGYENKAGFPICISHTYLPDQIVIEVADQGAPFNPFQVPPANLYGDQDHGYGWHIIRQIADHVVYTPKNAKTEWNRLSLFKNYYTKRDNIMEYTPLQREGALILQLESETLDAKQVPKFKESVLRMLDNEALNFVVIDLHKLQFIDSSGLGAFLSLLRHFNLKGGHLAFASMSKPVKSIFELVSMHKVFDCYDNVDLAVASKGKKKYDPFIER